MGQSILLKYEVILLCSTCEKCDKTIEVHSTLITLNAIYHVYDDLSFIYILQTKPGIGIIWKIKKKSSGHAHLFHVYYVTLCRNIHQNIKTVAHKI